MTGWAPVEEAGLVDVRTHGTRQLAVLATVAACLAGAILVLGGGLAGLATGVGFPLLLAALALVGVTLVSGWSPAAYIGYAVLGIGAALPSSELSWSRAAVLGVTIGLVHECVRFSIDTRKPTRLGASLLRRMSLGALLATVVVIIATPLVRGVAERDPDAFWVPAALAVVSVPLVVPWTVNRFAEDGRPERVGGTVLRSVVAVLLAVLVTVVVSLGAQHQYANRTDGTVDDPPPVEAVEDEEPPEPLYDEPTLSESLGALIGFFLAAAILGLLYGTFSRRKLLVEESVEIDLDDSVFAFSLPDRAELEDVALDREAAGAMLGELLVDLDAEQDPGRAIRFAYARIEQQLEARGVGRAASETAHESMQRLLPRLGDGRALRDLTDVFERARFSDQPVEEQARETARRALTDLQSQLDVLVVDDRDGEGGEAVGPAGGAEVGRT